ncbi:hypothetical protein EZS27_040184 [termite gut metagenome]|uniref:Uncharacterized protein n=1 Tax=termite gut metagenome TaxID=433724 RepID=A0A5J4PHZ0_9ZZZZ
MKTRDLTGPYPVCNMPFHKLTLVLITLVALSVASCRTVKQTQVLERETALSALRQDSIEIREERTQKIVKVPQETATLTLTKEQIDSLPVDALYESKSGRAGITLKKTTAGEAEITANCDSLNLVVESLYKEVFHLRVLESELTQKLNEQKVIEVNRLTSWQWFWNRLGQICFVALILYVAVKLVKKHFKII